ncbi:La domain-containing protein [Rutstroemia sp. NJR-2017a BBW]|nr:La domain-containing protein [Rutstroemia sp. NJR-2017a BBW]
MSEIKMEGQEPIATTAPTTEDVAMETEAAEPIKEEQVESGNAEIKEEKADAEVKQEAVDSTSAEVKEEKTDSEIKAEVKEEDTLTEEQKKNPTLKNGHTRKERTYESGVLKTTAQIDPNKKSNSKYDASVLPPSDDAGLIRAQVEFYLGDSNLPGDQFLWKATEGSENKPVPISTIHRFKRMQRFQPYELVVSALRESKFLVVEGEKGEETVKRLVAYDPNAPKSKFEARTVYIKGFGDEEPSSQFDIEAFMTPYGPLNAVRLRRTDEKLFKGSVYVEFADEKTAEAFLALDPKPLWRGKHKLDIKSKTQYMNEKAQEIRDGKKEPAQYKGGRGGQRGGRGRGGQRGNFKGRNGDRDPDDWKKRREEDKASGFKDRRGGRNDKHHRGGNRGRRDRRDGNDRNREREDNAKNGDEKEIKAEKPEANTEAAPAKAENEKKRAREDDTGADENPSKKVDIKPEVATEA